MTTLTVFAFPDYSDWILMLVTCGIRAVLSQVHAVVACAIGVSSRQKDNTV